MSEMLEAGRLLDRKAAEAMGCKVVPHSGSPDRYDSCGCAHYRTHAMPEPNGDCLNGYSTDAACVGEMLEWAADKGMWPEVKKGELRWVVRLWLDNTDRFVTGEAAELSEAVARAIVAAGPPQ